MGLQILRGGVSVKVLSKGKNAGDKYLVIEFALRRNGRKITLYGFENKRAEQSEDYDYLLYKQTRDKKGAGNVNGGGD